ENRINKSAFGCHWRERILRKIERFNVSAITHMHRQRGLWHAAANCRSPVGCVRADRKWLTVKDETIPPGQTLDEMRIGLGLPWNPLQLERIVGSGHHLRHQAVLQVLGKEL